MSEPNPVDNLLEGSTTGLISMSENQSLSTWSEPKRKEFVQMFTDRVRTARYILEQTSYQILFSAKRKRFISELHISKMRGKTAFASLERDCDDQLRHLCDYDSTYHCHTPKAGGRDIAELILIAKEKAQKILSELPILKQAIRIIDPETSAKMEKRDKLLEQGQTLIAQLDEANEAVKMSDVDQSMSVGEFLKFINERDKKRRRLVLRLNEIGLEGASLEDSINKKLFRGIPGLSDAIVAAAVSHCERATALDQMLRRVSEQVQFGDSTEAMELLKFFESDEAALPDTIANSIREAVEKLKIPVVKKLRSRS